MSTIISLHHWSFLKASGANQKVSHGIAQSSSSILDIWLMSLGWLSAQTAWNLLSRPGIETKRLSFGPAAVMISLAAALMIVRSSGSSLLPKVGKVW